MKELDERLERLESVVDGDGNGSPGLRIRTDRLEGKMLLIVWFAGIVTAGALANLVTNIVEKVSK